MEYRTHDEKKAYLDGYTEALTNFTTRFREAMNMEMRLLATLTENLYEESNESQDISGNV